MVERMRCATVFEQLVAGLVAARIVHMLEAVEVQEQHREHAVVALRLDERHGQVRLQEQAVGQTGELVVVREAVKLLVLLQQMALDLPPHGDIVHGHRQHRLPAQVQRVAGRLDAALRAVLAALLKLQRRAGA